MRGIVPHRNAASRSSRAAVDFVDTTPSFEGGAIGIARARRRDVRRVGHALHVVGAEGGQTGEVREEALGPPRAVCLRRAVHVGRNPRRRGRVLFRNAHGRPSLLTGRELDPLSTIVPADRRRTAACSRAARDARSRHRRATRGSFADLLPIAIAFGRVRARRNVRMRRSERIPPMIIDRVRDRTADGVEAALRRVGARGRRRGRGRIARRGRVAWRADARRDRRRRCVRHLDGGRVRRGRKRLTTAGADGADDRERGDGRATDEPSDGHRHGRSRVHVVALEVTETAPSLPRNGFPDRSDARPSPASAGERAAVLPTRDGRRRAEAHLAADSRLSFPGARAFGPPPRASERLVVGPDRPAVTATSELDGLAVALCVARRLRRHRP